MNTRQIGCSLIIFFMNSTSLNAGEIICNNDEPITKQRPIYIDCFEQEKILETLSSAALMLIFNKKISQHKKENNLCIDAFEEAVEIPNYLFNRQKAKELIQMCNKELDGIETK